MKNAREELSKRLKRIMPCTCLGLCAPDCSWCGYGGDLVGFIIEDRKRIVEPLVKAVEESERIGNKYSTVPAWQRLDKAVYETLKNAGIELWRTQQV